VERVTLTRLAELVEFQASLHGLLVLRRVVHDLFAGRTLKLDEVILGHNWWWLVAP
jgi:hypothetical protein